MTLYRHCPATLERHEPASEMVHCIHDSAGDLQLLTRNHFVSIVGAIHVSIRRGSAR